MTRPDVRLNHGDLVLVADGSKALLLINDGDEAYPNLKTDQVIEIDNPPTHEQGTERPGHFDKGSRTHRGAFEAQDLHDAAETGFAHKIAEMLDQSCAGAGKCRIMIVAAPHMLGELRKHLSAAVQGQIVAERDADLVNKPLHEIEALILQR